MKGECRKPGSCFDPNCGMPKGEGKDLKLEKKWLKNDYDFRQPEIKEMACPCCNKVHRSDLEELFEKKESR